MRLHPNDRDDTTDAGFGGDLFVLFFKVLWLSLVYSPFFGVGCYVFFTLSEELSVNEVVSLIAGLVAGYALFVFVAYIERASTMMRSHVHGWLALKALNILIVCGAPFYFAGSIATELVGPQKLGPIEFGAIFTFAGVAVALAAYFGVIGKLHDGDS